LVTELKSNIRSHSGITGFVTDVTSVTSENQSSCKIIEAWQLKPTPPVMPVMAISIEEKIPIPKQYETNCKTCSHVTGRGGCGEPVAAGLSAQDGVICYHGKSGKDCPAWIERINDDLEYLIQRAGTYWEYSPDDYILIRDLARRDPDGLRLALETDRAFSTEPGESPGIPETGLNGNRGRINL